MPSIRQIFSGTAAGLAGSLAMHGFRLVWEAAVSQDSRHAIFGFDQEADINGARRAYRLFSAEPLSESVARQLGIALHYGLGATFGMLYVLSGAPALSDASFGASLWICADEIPVTLSGISNPSAKSAASHVSALASHVLFAVVVTRTLRALNPSDATSIVRTRYGH